MAIRQRYYVIMIIADIGYSEPARGFYRIRTIGTENSEDAGSALTLPDGSIVIAGESSVTYL